MVGVENLEGLSEDVLLLLGEYFSLFSVLFLLWFHLIIEIVTVLFDNI